jgi:predicted acetyltransferase
MTDEIRVLDDETDLLEAANLFRAAMIGFPPLSPTRSGLIGKLLEPGRTLGLFRDGTLVATTDAATSTLTLPGGRLVGHAGVTHVGVAPTHTRQGLATALLSHQLRDVYARGEVVATLRASEATIYERFGYGVASSAQAVEVDTRRAVVRAAVSRGHRVRLLDPEQAWDVLPRIYRENRPTRPGSIDRPPVWWQTRQLKAESGPRPSYVAVYGPPGAETGFVRYHPINTDGWFTSDDRVVVVDDLFAPTPEAYGALVVFLLELDLVDRLRFVSLPLDDPLPWLLTDRRAVRVTGVRDETWLRIVDVAAALSERAYRDAGAVTLTVNDALLPHNSSTFRVSAEGAEPTDGRAHLEADIAAVSAALLGGTPWRALAAAGLVRVNDPDALIRADRLFAVDLAPHTGINF